MAVQIIYDLERATLDDFQKFADAQNANRMSQCVPFINKIVTSWEYEFDPQDPDLSSTLPVRKFREMAKNFLELVMADIVEFELGEGVADHIIVDLDKWTWDDLEAYQQAGQRGDYKTILELAEKALVKAPFKLNMKLNLETEFLPLMGVVRSELEDLFQ